MTSVLPAPGSLTGTGKRGGDGGKPPRKPNNGKGPRGHYSSKQITELRK